MYQTYLLLFVISLIRFFYSSYFLLTLKESNKEKAPETITSDMPYARYTSPIATGMSEVRAVSGLPPRRKGVLPVADAN